MKISKVTTINGDVFYTRGNIQKAMIEYDNSDSIIFFHGDSVYQDENDPNKYHICEGDVTSVALDQIAYVQVFKCKAEEYDECDCDCDDVCDCDDEDGDDVPSPCED